MRPLNEYAKLETVFALFERAVCRIEVSALVYQKKLSKPDAVRLWKAYGFGKWEKVF